MLILGVRANRKCSSFVIVFNSRLFMFFPRIFSSMPQSVSFLEDFIFLLNFVSSSSKHKINLFFVPISRRKTFRN